MKGCVSGQVSGQLWAGTLKLTHDLCAICESDGLI